MSDKRTRGKGKAAHEKYLKISAILLERPLITISEISEITGYSRSTICRLLKDHNSSKRDMRKRANLIEKLREELKNEISNG